MWFITVADAVGAPATVPNTGQPNFPLLVLRCCDPGCGHQPALRSSHRRLEQLRKEPLWTQPSSKDFCCTKHQLSCPFTGTTESLALHPLGSSGSELQLRTGVTFVLMDLLLAAFPSSLLPFPNRHPQISHLYSNPSSRLLLGDIVAIALNKRKEFSL